MKRNHAAMLAGAAGDGRVQKNAMTRAADDSDSMIVPPYDSKQEGLPTSPAFTEEFQTLTRVGNELVHLLKGPIEETKHGDQAVADLLQELKKRARSNSPEVRIALVGDVKAGKSSVINSLLSTGIVARQGEAGGSYTGVVQEFRYLLPKQTKSFAAEVHFFDQDERRAIIKALFADFSRAASKHDKDTTDTLKDSEQAVEHIATMRSTITAFRAMFSDHKEFSSVSSACDFMVRATPDDDDRVVESLCQWAEEMVARGLQRDSVVFSQSSTTQDLLWDIAPYLYTVEERAGDPLISPWPLVSHVKFGLDIELLKHNITLVDLPGVCDTSNAQARNTAKFLRQSDYTMIVAECGHCEDNSAIRDNFVKGCMTRGPGRTFLVLTHSDDIDEKTDVFGTVEDHQALDRLKSEVKESERQRSETSYRVNNAKSIEKHQYMIARHDIALRLRLQQARYQEQRIACAIG